MKRFSAALWCALGLAAAAPAHAQMGGGYLDLTYVANDHEKFTEDDAVTGTHSVFDGSGDGFGVRGQVRAANAFALTGEYRSVSHDFSGANQDTDESRLGLGLVNPTNSGVFVEWNKLKFTDSTNSANSISMDGWALRGRLAGNVTPIVQIYGDAGYVNLRDDDSVHWKGPEVSLGLGIDLNEMFSLIGDYRITRLKASDSGITREDDFDGVNLGARIRFGR